MDGKNLRSRQDLEVTARIQGETQGHVVTAAYREDFILLCR